jgi:HD-like signal output (HDOD) protein/CheY-like chemotaxis protein
MTRILFVDDEIAILESLRQMVNAQSNDWDTQFVASPKVALDLMEQSPADVVVADLKMPEMDGAHFLRTVKQRWPAAVRIMLTGFADQDAVVRASVVAHQLLAKPCESQLLRQTIGRTLALREVLRDRALRQSVGSIDRLPSAPRIYSQLTIMLSNGIASTEQMADLIEQDAALAGKVLHLANSAFFGSFRAVTSIQQAVALIGTNMLRGVVLAVETRDAFKIKDAGLRRYVEEVQIHGATVARIASRLYIRAPGRDAAFTAGLMHDIGKLVLASCKPETFAEVLAMSRDSGRPLHEVEKQGYGVTHAEIGAYLLGLWGLPYAVIEAVAFHHRPELLGTASFDPAGAVMVADALAHDRERDPVDPPGPAPESLVALVRDRGVAEHLEEWRKLTRELAEDK